MGYSFLQEAASPANLAGRTHLQLLMIKVWLVKDMLEQMRLLRIVQLACIHGFKHVKDKDLAYILQRLADLSTLLVCCDSVNAVG